MLFRQAVCPTPKDGAGLPLLSNVRQDLPYSLRPVLGVFLILRFRPLFAPAVPGFSLFGVVGNALPVRVREEKDISLYIFPLTVIMAARAARGAVSVRRMRGPSVAGVMPCAAASSTSLLSKPPSGPTKRLAVRVASPIRSRIGPPPPS